jgi:FtsH-binding integral membrane protein
MNNYYGSQFAQPQAQPVGFATAQVNSLLRQVYLIMTIGLTITGLTAFLFQDLAPVMLQGGLGIVLMFAPLAFVLILSFGINKLSPIAATAIFGLFAVAMGLSLTSIFWAYEIGGIATTFFVTAGTFAAMSIIGLTTKTDLTKMGSYLMMALIGIIIAGVVNWFVGSSMLSLIISVVGILVFTGLTAYDTQRIQQMGETVDGNSEMGRKLAIHGALSLYLNFINLFLLLLRFLGGNRD